jgi:hypothetical protein
MTTTMSRIADRMISALSRVHDELRAAVSALLGKQVVFDVGGTLPCGGYGCVVFTYERAGFGRELPWVVKLTESVSEARFWSWLSEQQATKRGSRPLRRGFAIGLGVFEVVAGARALYAIVKEKVEPLSLNDIENRYHSDKLPKTCTLLYGSLGSLDILQDLLRIRLDIPSKRIKWRHVSRVAAECFPEIVAGLVAAAERGVAMWDVRPDNMGIRIHDVAGLGVGYPIAVDPEPSVQGNRRDSRTSKTIGLTPRTKARIGA